MVLHDLRDFGCAGDGITDDTACFQAAVSDSAHASKLMIPCGTFLISKPITIPGALSLCGISPRLSIIKIKDPTKHGFIVTTADEVDFEKFSIITGPPSGPVPFGAAILFDPSAPLNWLSTIRDVRVQGGFIGLDMTNAAGWCIDRCYLAGQQNLAVHVACPFSPDDGDSTIINSFLSGLGTHNTLILQESSGGLRLANNKLIGGDWGYLLSMVQGVVTSDLLIIGNSFEMNTLAAIMGIGSASQFSNILITANQFMGTKRPISFGGMPGVSHVAVTGNVMLSRNGKFQFVGGDGVICTGNSCA